MTKLLLVLSKDPFTTEIPELVTDIAIEAKGKGADVSLYLIEDGVTAARHGGFSERIVEIQKKGIKVFADDKSVLSRGIYDKLIDGVEIKEIETLLDFIVDDYDRTAWF
ncbi:MAG: DsrE family protein [Methanosarcinaceae archaeon]|nr:DsrE family protein [Methanosarcinaceae archaeon]